MHRHWTQSIRLTFNMEEELFNNNLTQYLEFGNAVGFNEDTARVLASAKTSLMQSVLKLARFNQGHPVADDHDRICIFGILSVLLNSDPDMVQDVGRCSASGARRTSTFLLLTWPGFLSTDHLSVAPTLHVTSKIISSTHDTSPISIQTGVIKRTSARAQRGTALLLTYYFRSIKKLSWSPLET